MRPIFVMAPRSPTPSADERSLKPSARTASGAAAKARQWTASPRHAWRAAEHPRARAIGRVAGEAVDRAWEHHIG